MNTRRNKNHFKPIIFYFHQITEINKYKIIANESRLGEERKKKEQIEDLRKEDLERKKDESEGAIEDFALPQQFEEYVYQPTLTREWLIYLMLISLYIMV